MASGPVTDIERFRGWVNPLVRFYPTIDVRILAFRKEGVTYNLLTKLIVSPHPLPSIKFEDIHAHPSFLIRRGFLPSRDLPKILDGLPAEQFRSEEDLVDLWTPPNPQTQPNQTKQPLWWHASRDFAEIQYWDGRSPSGEPVRRYSLDTNSNEGTALVSTEVLDALHLGLLRCRPRWLGFPDLMKRFLQTEHNVTMHNNTHFRIELPIRCQQGDAVFEAPGSLVVPVAAPGGIARRFLKVNALLARASGAAWSEEAKVDPVEGVDEDGIGTFLAHMASKDAAHATIHVLLDDQIVDKRAYDLWDLEAPNPRMAIISSLGNASDQLNEMLADPEGKGQNAETFEVVVSNLLATCGFVTFNPGRKHAKAGETVDVMVVHPMAPEVFCVECTWKVANPEGKLPKLVQRAHEIERRLPGYRVTPILVVSKLEVSAVEQKAAADLKVTLLTVEHLIELRKQAAWNVGPSAVALWLTGNQQLKTPT